MASLTSSHKYHGEQSDRYDGKVHWPGANGFPFLGETAPSLRQHELDALPTTAYVQNDVFDLNDEASRDKYTWVCDHIRNGLFVRDYIERRWPKDSEFPVIYMEWTQCYVQAPKSQPMPGREEHGSSRKFTLPRPEQP